MRTITICAATLLALASAAGSARAANYPLQILAPRAAGSSPDPGGQAIDPNHRIFWAYPGVEYNIRANAIGGAYPFSYELTNAPAGMTISARGVISWANPQSSAQDIRLAVTDAEGTRVESAWSVSVDASKFVFLNCLAPTNGNGGLGSPFNRYSGIPLGTHANKILYFRNGTCRFLDMPKGGVMGSWERVELSPTNRPTVWLEFPGESSVLDFGFSGVAESGSAGAGAAGTFTDATKNWIPNQWAGYVLDEYSVVHAGFRINGNDATTLFLSSSNAALPENGRYMIYREAGALLRFNGSFPYLDGFETVNARIIGFQFGAGSHYGEVRRMDMRLLGPGGGGRNSAFIMFLTGNGLQGSYFSITDSAFHDTVFGGGLSCVKFYSQFKPLVADNLFYNVVNAPSGSAECFAQKATTTQLHFRNNRIWNMGNLMQAVGGNMHGQPNTSSGEYSFNDIRGAMGLRLNQDGLSREVYVKRNTIQGSVEVSQTGSTALTGGPGPFHFSGNVIETDGALGACLSGHSLTCPTPRDASRIVLAPSPNGDLVCSRSQDCVNDDGSLTEGFASYSGTHGYQLGAAGPPQANAPPASPRGMRLQ